MNPLVPDPWSPPSFALETQSREAAAPLVGTGWHPPIPAGLAGCVVQVIHRDDLLVALSGVSL